MSINTENYSFSLNNQLPIRPIFNNIAVEKRLNKFCEQVCPGVTLREMKEYIQNGEKLAKSLTDSKLPVYSNTKEAARDLTWFLMAMAACTEEEYTNGVFRIEDKDQKLYFFLNSCTDEKTGGSYGRISTHYKNQLKGQKQRGLDMAPLKLPVNKRTLLFSHLPDGTTFIKLEEHGFPPFWQNGFRSLENFKEFVGHSIDFINYKTNIGYTVSLYDSKRETISNNDLKSFKSSIKLLKREDLQKGKVNLPVLDAPFNPLKQIEKEARKFGISKMTDLLEKEIVEAEKHLRELKKSRPFSIKEIQHQEDALLKAQSLYADFKQKLEKDHKKKYEGERQGNEVVLPSFEKFFKTSE